MTDTRPPATLSPRVVLTVGVGLVAPSLPAFLVGAAAVQVRAELGMSAAALGAMVAALFLVSAATAPMTGRIADRRGARFSIVAGTSLSAASLAGIGLLAQNWVQLAAFMVCAGVGLALVDPGLTRLVAGRVPAGRRGMLFGIKEASIPVATMAAGFAVPAIAVTVGWRWIFAVGLIPIALVVSLVATGRDVSSSADTGTGGAPASEVSTPRRQGTWALATGAALALMAATGISVFMTESAVAAGLTQSQGGVLLGVASVVGVVVRISSGMAADRRPDLATRLIPAMIVVGAVTMLVGATGTGVLLGVGAVGAIAGGWGWTALFFLTLVRADPTRPGAMAGVGLSGLAVGNALGPVVFGFVASSVSYAGAWLTAAVAAGAAAALMYVGGRRLSVAERDGDRGGL